MTRTLTFLKSVVLVTMLASVAYAAGDEDVFGLQPEIHHVFREAEKMPPVTFSYLFTLIALSPWLLLIGGWFQLGYTPGNVISELTSGDSLRTVYITSFLASLVSMEYLFYLYFTRFNLVQTLIYMSALSVITFLTGQRALSSIQAKRIANIKK